MIPAALLAGLHYLALPIGMGGLFMRGRYLRALERKGRDPELLSALFAADNFWGVAALIWIVTGLTRAFGHVEKSSDFYLRNGLFWVKMALFGLIFALEIWPMVTLIRWRIVAKKGSDLPAFDRLAMLARLDDVELALLVVIPFVAAGMARGLWLF